jgi:glycosyltransferase involved in cell wall biosynthesis
MAGADLFVLSSLQEGLPVVLMEALALEVPVIAPRIAGIPELVVDGESGALFTAGDWSELSEKIADLARDPRRRAALAAAGRARVVEAYQVERAVEPLVALFRASEAAAPGRRPVAPCVSG